MSEASLFALLLPLGVMLMQSGATPRSNEARVAAIGLVTLALATLSFVTVGFGFMFGGVGIVASMPDLSRYATYYTLPVGAQNWGIIGLRGFLLNSVSEASAVQLFVTYLPLAMTCALFTVPLTHSRASIGAQLLITIFISGFLFPLLGFWLWGGGWLAALGINLNLGHGAVDLGGLTTAALAAGGAGLALLLFVPHRSEDEQLEFPATYHPFRSLSGLVIALIGAASITAGNPLLGANGEHIAAVLLLNGGVAVSSAVLVALLYTVITIQKPDLSAAARAATGALIAISAGTLLLPTWAALSAGVLAGLLATAGLYTVNHLLHISDDVGFISSILVPGMLGLLLIGLFANGTFGQGLNNVGATTYMGLASLGVTGLIPAAGAPGDTGQMTAQIVGAFVAPAMAFVLFSPIAWLLNRAHLVRQNVQVERDSQSVVEPVPTLDTPVQTSVPEMAPSIAQVDLDHLSTPVYVPVLETAQPIVAQSSSPTNNAAGEVNGGQTSEPTPELRHRESLLERLRRARKNKPEQEQPIQPRHVAYPNRVAGRRLSIRPMTRPEGTGAPENSGPSR
jgi:Amt family ammonium transporter